MVIKSTTGIMPPSGFACTRHFLLLVFCSYCASHVAAQCVMEEKDGFSGDDTTVQFPTPTISSFDDCKAYCLGDDQCTAVEFRSGICIYWIQDPNEASVPGYTIALKVCTPDPSSSLWPSEDASEEEQITTSLTTAATAAVCPYEVKEITGPVDYVQIDGGPTFGDNAYTADGWESVSVGGDTLTISLTDNTERTLQQLSFIVRNGQGTLLSIVLENAPGSFEKQDAIAIGSNEQLYTRRFHTSFTSISYTTTATISELTLTFCYETPDGGATRSTLVLQTSSVMSLTSSVSHAFTSSDLISPSQTVTVSDDEVTSSTPVLQTSVELETIETIMTSDMLSTSDIFMSSDLISSTVTVTTSATPTPTACTMVEMADTDASNTGTEYTLEGPKTCQYLCESTEQCQHFVYDNAMGTCKLYTVSSITSFYQINHTLFSKRSCDSGKPCCFDIDINASSSDESALVIKPTADACREFCLAFDFCQAAVFNGGKCKALSIPAVTLARDSVVLFKKECPTDVQSPLTRTGVCSKGGITYPNAMMTVVLAGFIVTGFFVRPL